MNRSSSWLRAYWRRTPNCSRWRLAAGIGSLLALLLLIGTVSGGCGEETAKVVRKDPNAPPGRAPPRTMAASSGGTSLIDAAS